MIAAADFLTRCRFLSSENEAIGIGRKDLQIIQIGLQRSSNIL